MIVEMGEYPTLIQKNPLSFRTLFQGLLFAASAHKGEGADAAKRIGVEPAAFASDGAANGTAPLRRLIAGCAFHKVLRGRSVHTFSCQG